MKEKESFKEKPKTKELLNQIAELKQVEAKCYEMEKTVKETQSRYKALFDSTFSCVYIHDLEGNFIDANKTALKLLGYTEQDISSLNLSSLLHKNQLKTALETVEEIKKTGYMINPSIYKVRKKNGDYIWMEVVATLIYHEGKPYAIQGIAQDITERKRTEEALRKSEEQHRTMIETMNEGLSVVDQKGIMSFVNDQFCEMLGYSREELLGSNETLLLDEENQRILRKQWSNRIKGDAMPYEITLTKKNGKKIHTLVAPRPILDGRGQFSGSFGIFTDITVLKQVQEELLSYQEQLRSLASELSLVEERQRRCIATELNDYIGQKLYYCKNKLVDLKQSEFSGNPKESTDEIIDLIDQTIEYTKSLTLQLGTPLLYKEGLESALKWLGYQFQKQLGLVFHFKDDQKPKPLNDETTILLYQAVRELLLNVSRHAKARNIHLSIKRDYKKVQIEVKDDGIGFDVSQIGSHSSRTSGFGLFAIHERLKYLGGHFKIESVPDEGTHAVLIVPLRSHI